MRQLIEWLGQFDQDGAIYLQEPIDGLWDMSLAITVPGKPEIHHLTKEIIESKGLEL